MQRNIEAANQNRREASLAPVFEAQLLSECQEASLETATKASAIKSAFVNASFPSDLI